MQSGLNLLLSKRAAVMIMLAGVMWLPSVSSAQQPPSDPKAAAQPPCVPAVPPARLKRGDKPLTFCPGKPVPLQSSSSSSPTQQSAPAAPPPARAPRGKGKKAPPRGVVTVPAFRMLPDGGSRMTVRIYGLTSVTEYSTTAGFTYVLDDAKVPVRNNRNPLPMGYFNTPVGDARLLQVDDKVHFVVDLRAPAQARARLVELARERMYVLQVDFPAGSYPTAGPPARAPSAASQPATPPPGKGFGGDSVLGPPVP